MSASEERQERRLKLQREQTAADPESLEWWRACSCLFQMEREDWKFRYCDAQEREANLKKEVKDLSDKLDAETNRLKAKLYDLMEKNAET